MRLAAIEPGAKISLYSSFHESDEGKPEKPTKVRPGDICTGNALEMIDVGAVKIRGQCTTVLMARVATVAPAAKRPPISNESCQCFQCRMESLFRLKLFFFRLFPSPNITRYGFFADILPDAAPPQLSLFFAHENLRNLVISAFTSPGIPSAMFQKLSRVKTTTTARLALAPLAGDGGTAPTASSL